MFETIKSITIAVLSFRNGVTPYIQLPPPPLSLYDHLTAGMCTALAIGHVCL